MLDYIKISQSPYIETEDEKYLERFLYSFYNVFFTELAAVKNLNSEFIAASKPYTEMVGSTLATILCKQDQDLPFSNTSLAQFYRQQDLLIQQEKTSKSFLEVNTYIGNTKIHIVHKSPVINYSTKNIIAILTRMEKYKANIMYMSIAQMHKGIVGLHKCKNINLKLGAIQAEVLFCLVLGLRGDKTIAEFINKIKNTQYTNKNIKYAITELYKKFETNNRDVLVAKAIHCYHFIPQALISIGSYPISDISTCVR